MNRSEKKDFVSNIREELNNSSTVVVTHYSGLTVKEIDELRKAMRTNGAKFKITKNSLTKLALADTKIKSIADLFNGPTAIAYSDDAIVPAKVAVEFEKKYKNLKILGGSFEGEKVDEEKIKVLAMLPSLDEVRGTLIGLLTSPAQKIASILQTPASQLARLVEAQSKKLESSN